MSLAPSDQIGTIIGQFQEKDYGHYFEYRNADKNEFGLPHMVFCGGINNREIRFGKVLKTVAYICTDEGVNGEPIMEKWYIKHNWRK